MHRLWAGMMLTVVWCGLATPIPARAEDDVTRVLFLSSYSPSFPTFFQQIDGIRQTFERLGYAEPALVLDIEVMDSKRFPDKDHGDLFLQMLAYRLLEGPPYDVVLVADDNALILALEHHDTLLGGAPIVFLGVNDLSLAQAMNANDNVTGVVEALSIADTLRMIEAQLPDAETLYVISGVQTTGRLIRAQFEHDRGALSRLQVEHLSLADLTYDELAERLTGISERDPILRLAAYGDKAGTSKTHHEVMTLIRNSTNAPVFSLWRHALGERAVGGKIVSHFEQARVATELAVKIIEGASPAHLPVVTESPNVFMFNHSELIRVGIDPNGLPPNSVILGAPPPVLDALAPWLPVILPFLVIQTAIIVVLIANNRRRRTAERMHAAAEARFRDFAESSADWFWEMDKDLKFTYFSPRFQEMTGVEPDDVLGTSRLEQLNAEAENLDSEKWRNHLHDLAEHRPFKDFRYQSRHGGAAMHLSVSGKPVFDEVGDFAGYRGTSTDITRQVEAESALIGALADAERANEAKSEFLATMSHEFRTPLNAILGFSDMIKNQTLGPIGTATYANYASDIHLSGEHMLALVNDILDIAEIEAGERKLAREAIEVGEALGEIVTPIRAATKGSNIKIELDVDPTVSPILADRRAFTQVVSNLTTNAIKFSSGGATVTIRAFNEGDMVAVVIQDTGIGIPASQIETITKPFARAHDDPHITHDGAGLGLSIVKSLVESHGGEITIESTVGAGTTVTVTFPKAYGRAAMVG